MMEDDNESISSINTLESILPIKTPFKKSILGLIVVLICTTIMMLILSCWYGAIAGNAAHWFGEPQSWQFCLVYSSATYQLVNENLIDQPATIFSQLAVFNCIYTWIALCVTFRALRHFEWIPSTIVCLLFIIFQQLCYYQSSVLLIIPSKLQVSLLAATKYISSDMYKNLGKFCFLLKDKVTIGTTSAKGWQYPFESLQTWGGITDGNITDGNCTDSFLIFPGDNSDNSTLISVVPNSELNCDGAVNMNFAFLAGNYILVGITVICLIVLIVGDFNIRQNKPVRHFIKSTGEDLFGAIPPQIFVSIATIGFLMTNMALCDAALGALDSVNPWPLVDVDLKESIDENIDLGITNLAAEVALKVDLEYYMKGWLPGATTSLNIQTILLVVTAMAVIRGFYKQSISAFRLAAVTSLLQVFCQWPAIIGNLYGFDANDLWWWQDTDKCNSFFADKQFLYPSDDFSERLCLDSRMALLGSLIQLASMTCNIVACAFVYIKNLERISIRFEDWQAVECDDHNPLTEGLIVTSFTSLDEEVGDNNTKATAPHHAAEQDPESAMTTIQ